MPGDDNHGQRIVDGANSVEHFEAVHSGHFHIEQYQVGCLAFDKRKALLARGGTEKFVSFVLEGHLQRVTNGGLVVNDENA